MWSFGRKTLFGWNQTSEPDVTTTATRRLRIVLSYAPDWIISLLVGGLFFVIGNMSGFKREFSLDDTSLQHTFAVHERITNTNLFLISVVAPLVLMPIINIITVRSFWDWHNSWLGVVCSVAYAGTATNIVKVTVGRPRPDLIDRCQPIPGAADHAVFGLSTVAICTQTDKGILDDGWKSFFSGHSSLSFAGLGFLGFYLAGKLHLFDQRGNAGKAWLSMVPIAGASLVAISRTMDNRHHWQDVLVGSAVGLAFAYFAYRQYYPPLTSPNSHKPYVPRVDQHHRRGSSLLPLTMNNSNTHAPRRPSYDQVSPFDDAENAHVVSSHNLHNMEDARTLEADRTIPHPEPEIPFRGQLNEDMMKDGERRQ